MPCPQGQAAPAGAAFSVRDVEYAGRPPAAGPVFDAVEGFDELRDWLGGQWKAGEASWTPQARLIFEELELADGARRSLLESPTFRALLEEKPALAAAA